MREPLQYHPNKQAVLEQLLAGVPIRQIAKQAGVSPASIIRFKQAQQRNIQAALDPINAVTNSLKEQGLLADSADPEQLRNATGRIAGTLASTSGLVARIEENQAVLSGAIKQAGLAKDYRGISNLLSVDCKRIELLGKLTGVLHEGGHAGPGSLNIVVMLPEGSGPAGPVVDATCEPIDS